MKLLLNIGILFLFSAWSFGAGFVNDKCVCGVGVDIAGTHVLSSSQVGFFTASPVAQQSNIGAITDSTGGTVGSTISDVGLVFAQLTLNDNFATLIDRINKIESVLQSYA
jgi:hypothetical protein